MGNISDMGDMSDINDYGMSVLGDIFNTSDIATQPSSIVHHHIFGGKSRANDSMITWVAENTARGQHFQEFPLTSQWVNIKSKDTAQSEATDKSLHVIHVTRSHSVEEVVSLGKRVANKYHVFFLFEIDSFLEAFVLTAASQGLVLSSSATGERLCRFIPKTYSIRAATVDDLESLLLLECACWPETLQTSALTLSTRIQNYPLGQLVIVSHGHVVGVVYSQRIQNHHCLKTQNFRTVEALTDLSGASLQLLALNVLPTVQNQALGDDLLTFVLEKTKVTDGLELVVGVTRCKAYPKHAHMPYKAFIHARDSTGISLDPVLNFHISHGANVVEAIPDYRPTDVENQGYGVFVYYDLNALHPPAFNNPPSIPHASVEEILTQAIQNFSTDYTPSLQMSSFLDIGLDSVDLLSFSLSLGNRLGVFLPSTLFFKFPTPHTLLQHLTLSANTNTSCDEENVSIGVPTQSLPNTDDKGEHDERIAVIGMACRAPGGVTSTSEYWHLLRESKNGVSDALSDRRNLGNDDKTPGGFLPNISHFDPTFFHISPREAVQIDPQQRLLLETHWEAAEMGGVLPESLVGTSTGVFVGISSHDYETLGIKHGLEGGNSFLSTGSSNAVAAGRVSYFLGLNGPAMAIDTACSSSLVSVHVGVGSLLRHDCDLAFVSGVNVILSGETTERYRRAGMLSPTHACYTFDARADGYVRAEGVGVLLLKRLRDAERDGNKILGVILGSAVTQDGWSNGLTAPNLTAQEAVYRKALQSARTHPHDVDFVEAHGTGTSLGDFVESESLANVYGKGRQTELCVGSLKTQIGHAEAAAGIMGTIKVILALKNKFMPSNLNFRLPNPHLKDLVGLRVLSEGVDWTKRSAIGRRGAVSSFGFSGTNAHIILEEPPLCPATLERRSQRHIVTASAPNSKSLKLLVDSYVSFLRKTEASVCNVAFTTVTARTQFKHRISVTGATVAEILANFTTFQNTEQPATSCEQRWALGFDDNTNLTLSHPLFLKEKERCMEMIAQTYVLNLCPTKVHTFVSQYALGKVLMDFCRFPAYAFGVGIGQFVVASLAGVIQFKDAIALLSANDAFLKPNKHKFQAPKFPLVCITTENIFEKVDKISTFFNSHSAFDVCGILSLFKRLQCENIVLNGEQMGMGTELNANIDDHVLTTSLSHLYNAGIISSLQSFYAHEVASSCLVTDLPTYAFEREHYWITLSQTDVSLPKKCENNEKNLHSQVEWSCAFEEVKKMSPRAADLSIVKLLQEMIKSLVGIEPGQYETTAGFISLGLDSMILGELRQMIEKWLGHRWKLPSTSLFDYPSIQTLSAYLQKMTFSTAPSSERLLPIKSISVNSFHESALKGVGVVGIACRFGTATTPTQFWNLLAKGETCVGQIPKSRFDVKKYYSSGGRTAGRMYVQHGSFLPSIDLFDGGLFGICPKEIEVMDPQQRLLLEVVWEALERSGIPPPSIAGTKTGVFIGQTWNDYGHELAVAQLDLGLSSPYICSGNAYATTSGRVAYTFGTLGPALTVDTACSSSLMAVHLAIAALERGEIDLAIAGGVNLLISQLPWLNLCQAGMLSPEGVSYTFDARACGYARGEGVGVVILKHIADAVTDKNHILVKLHSTSNQDGRTSGFTVPNGTAQAELIQSALALGQLEPSDVDLIEAHGTSTSLGDPIEVGSLEKVFQGRSSPIFLTSCKGNFNHTEAAAGICGLIKCILAIQHRQIPPQANFDTLNPNMTSSFHETFTIPLVLTPWTPRKDNALTPRRAGVNSFGFSGTNVHVLLEEVVSPAYEESKVQPRSFHILTASAKSEKSLQLLLSAYKEELKCLPDSEFTNFLHTSNTGRAHFKHRTAIVAGSKDELLRSLECPSMNAIPKTSTLIFLLNMSLLDCLFLARGIYASVPTFASTLDSTVELCKDSLQLKKFILQNNLCERKDDVTADVAQFVVQYAFVKVLAHWGLEAEFLVGPEGTIGQLLAATFSNALPLVTAITNLYRSSESKTTFLLTDQMHGQTLTTVDGLLNNVADGTWVGLGSDLELNVNFSENVDPWKAILSLVAQIYLKGFTPNFPALNESFGFSKIQIPTYAFDRKRYWMPSLEEDKKESSKPPAMSQASFYQEQWTEVATFEREKKDVQPSHFFLLSTNSALLDTYDTALQEIGHSAVKVQLSNSACDFSLSDTNGEVHIFNPSHFGQLAQLGKAFNSILFLYSEVSDTAAILDTQMHNLVSFLHILQNLRALSVPLVLVTSGRAPILGKQCTSFVHSLWATLRSVGREDPTLDISSFDVDSNIPLTQNLSCLFETLDKRMDIQVAFRQNKLYAPRLMAHQITPAVVKFHAHKTYLVTGGLGGIGLQLARWLAESGVRSLVLVGRRSPDTITQAFLKQLKETYSDLHISIIQSDVSSKESVYSLLQEIIQTLPELAGIFHAAGVFCDATLVNQSTGKFETAFAAKAFGAQFLHSASLDFHLNLDYFVLFSSVSAILGPIGKSNYAAANAFLDSLALLRHRDGLSAQSIRWGAWGEFGMAAADPAFGENNSGIRAFPPKDGLAALGSILASKETTATFCRFDWSRWQQQHCWDRHWLSAMDNLLPPILKVTHSTTKSLFMTQFEKMRNPSNQRRLTQEHVRHLISKIAGLPLADVECETKFSDLGLDSLMFMDLQQGIQDSLGNLLVLPTTLVFDYSTPQLLSDFLATEVERVLQRRLNHMATKAPCFENASTSLREQNECIAVIGLACRLPGNVSSADDFWKLLVNGDCTIEQVPNSRYDVEKYYDPERGASGKLYCRYGSFISHHDKFDSEFFQINSKEANLMDPQQRHLLEVSYEALENAAIPVRSLAGSRTGTFVGISNTDYHSLLLEKKHHAAQDYYHVYTFTGNALSTAAGRVAHTFNFQGPTLSIDTACSSSLVAVHEAVQSLRRGDSDLALAGGVNLVLSPDPTIQVSKANMLASRCMKTFDAAADGYIRGDGVGVVVLKRQKDAEAAGDNILALIRATGINHDGSSATLTSPNSQAQVLLLNSVIAEAGIAGSEVDFLETHGTATRIGDPIEVSAIQNSAYGQRSRPLTLGAGKTLVGHLESAAGIVSLIKVVLTLQHGVIPRNHNFSSLNPLIDNGNGLLQFPVENAAWLKDSNKPRIAGVSSFGMSGTNAHAILQQPPSTQSRKSHHFKAHLFTLSAKTETALDTLKASFLSFLNKDVNLADLCHTVQVGREHYAHRLALTASTVAGLRDKLSQCELTTQNAKEVPSVAIVFSDQTACIPSKNLYEHQEVYKSAIDACQQQISQFLPGFSLTAYVGPQLSRVEADVLHFCAQYAMCKELEGFGIYAAQVVGTGLGLLVAACVFQNLSLENAFSWFFASEKSEILFTNDTVRILDANGVELNSLTQDNLTTLLHLPSVASTLAANSCTLGISIDASLRTCSLSKGNVHFLSMSEQPSEWESVLETLAHLYMQGWKINFQSIRGGHKIHIPTYPFLKRRHWAKSLETKDSGAKVVEMVEVPVLDNVGKKTMSRDIDPIACILGCSSNTHLPHFTSVEDEVLAACFDALEDAVIPTKTFLGSNANIFFNVVNTNFLAPSIDVAQRIKGRLGLCGISVESENNDMSVLAEAVASIENELTASFSIVGSVLMEDEVLISSHVLILKSFKQAISSNDRILRVINEIDASRNESLLDDHISCKNISDLCRLLKDNVPNSLCVDSLNVECSGFTPSKSTTQIQKNAQILTLSASTTSELSGLCQIYENLLLECPSVERLADIAFTTNTGRTHLQKRLAIVGNTPTEMVAKLKSVEMPISGGERKDKVVFLFTGQGAQYSGMGKYLFSSNTTFRSCIEECDTILRGELSGKSIIELMFDAEMGNLLHRTEYAQPCLFSLEYSLACMWLHFGVTPDYLIGHSVGEYVAATLAGVLTLSQGLSLIAHRARLMQSLPEGVGGMLAVKASVDSVMDTLLELNSASALQLAAINSPTQVVVSGPLDQLDTFSSFLKTKGIRCTKLNVSHAFHSSLLSPIAQEFRTIAQKVDYGRPKFKIISNVTGEVMEEYSADYWLAHLLSTVNFVASVAEVGKLGGSLWLEVGPKPLLLTLVKQIRAEQGGVRTKLIPTLSESKNNWESVMEGLGVLYEAGITPQFKNCYPAHSVRRVKLPSHLGCFDNTRCKDNTKCKTKL